MSISLILTEGNNVRTSFVTEINKQKKWNLTSSTWTGYILAGQEVSLLPDAIMMDVVMN